MIDTEDWDRYEWIGLTNAKVNDAGILPDGEDMNEVKLSGEYTGIKGTAKDGLILVSIPSESS